MALCGLCLWLASGVSWGAADCTITSTPITFGNYDPLSSTALAGTGTLSFSCDSGVGVGTGTMPQVLLSTGSGTYLQRTMTNGANILNYNLYTSASYATVWGDGTAGTGTITGTYAHSNSPPTIFTMYGLIPALQNPPALLYTDSITATVNF
jgi:spore coat protein U-like protein